MLLGDLENYLKKILDFEVNDTAINGVQVENVGKIERIVSGVDFCEASVDRAIEKKANVLLTHHGLFWGKQVAITGRYYTLIKKLIENNIALIALHLPLDLVIDFGNNHSLIKALDLEMGEAFGNYKGIKLLFSAAPKQSSPLPYKKLVERFEKQIGKVLVSLAHGEENVKKIAVCSGGGLFGIEDAKTAGCDTLITGDASHVSYHLSKELHLNLLCGGHYNTETFGVINLGNKIAREFNIKHTFIDIPTHL